MIRKQRMTWCYVSSRCTLSIIVVLSLSICIAYWQYIDITRCDAKEAAGYVRSKEGKYLQKVSPHHEYKLYSELSYKCSYDKNGQIDCPVVKLKGETMIRQIQLVITRLMIVTDLICRKHGIKYWLLAGSLLGAARNNRFIPWDNDGDIAMLRSDYVKFLKACQTDLPKGIWLQTTDSDPDYHVYQRNEAKLRDQNSCFALCLRYGCDRHDGLMLDIFVLDKLPEENPIAYQNKWKRFKYEHDEIFPLREMVMEGYHFYVPNKYEDILKREYHNYWEYPPEYKLCPSKGYIGHPWYSCEEIAAMPKDQKNKVIQESMISRNLLLYYFAY